MGVDWQAVDILLKNEKVKVTSQQFRDWRIALGGYIQIMNEHIVNN
ncbi:MULTISPECIES: hypothetical protein [Pasteurellaceae]|uniref:Uncharacterized protein n=1 Tax=Pasteurella atlantica TaxID=2827233 RepID=A0AAW8CQ29_9PAST|nr:hypothetical protein [Pasteurella atlantica]MBR0573683.1 hypothetical protein [Pasteurella atlantica]MDP8039684.1 hypothetical protein [Pasteurella atlantica]MDP8041775.1 hypothetical protein [Pasteurella atlantica]MDP8043951.1 hypothetical protein [Pasteurella atlantica]MDP8045929.1 hypothetical protein [Pasteurella atlantica]